MGFIIINPTTNRPMQAGQALTLLKDTNALEKLRANGFTAGEFRAAVDIPGTESTLKRFPQIISLVIFDSPMQIYQAHQWWAELLEEYLQCWELW